MSYASAALNAISDEPVFLVAKPQSKAAPAQPKASVPKSENGEIVQEKPVVPQEPLVGNDGGDLGNFFKNQKVVFRLLSLLKPQDVANLGRTCKYLFGKILEREDIINRFCSVKTMKPTIVFKLDCADSSGVVKSSNLTSFLRSERRLFKYWQDEVANVLNERAPVNPLDDLTSRTKKDEVKVTLHGGLHFSKSSKDSVTQRDLSRTVRWLEAVIGLLENRDKVQEVPYLDGKARLSRFGLGGTSVQLSVGTDENLTIHRYNMSAFCHQVHTTVKTFVPIVGSCVVSMSRGTRQVKTEESAQYLEQEAVLKKLLNHQRLHGCLKRIKMLLQKGTIPRCGLHVVFRTKREDKLRHQAQQRVEHANMYDFMFQNMPDDLQKVKDEAAHLLNEHKQKEEDERELRRQRYEQKIADSVKDEDLLDWNMENVEPEEVVPKGPKKKVIDIVDEDGFKGTKVVWEQEGEEIDAPVTETVTVVKKPQKVNALKGNPFAAVLQESAFVSIVDDQTRKQNAKAHGRDVADQKRREVANRERKANKGNGNKQAQNQLKRQNNQKQNNQKQNNQKQNNQKQNNQKQNNQRRGQNQKNNQKNRQNKKSQQNRGKKQEESSSFQPAVMAVAVLGICAFGYVFLSGGF